jgi:thioredoxin 1
MPFMRDYLAAEPAGADVEAQAGWQLLEFGAPWCGHCQAAQPALQAFVDAHDLCIEDGKESRWACVQGKTVATVVLLHDGQEVARVVRPVDSADLATLQGALPD